jgi:methyl-accepting chemotaxis protein
MSSEKGDRFKSRRSRVLWEITALVAVVYILGGLFAFLIASNSYSRLAQKSTDKLIAEKADSIASANAFLAQTEMTMLMSKVPNIDRAVLYAKLAKQDKNDLDPLQVYLNDRFATMRANGLLGLEYLFMIIPTNPLTKNPIVIGANDPNLVYMDVPDYMKQAIEEEKSWILVDGVPELGISGEALITFSKIQSPVSDVNVYFTGITPMSTEVGEVKAFYQDEKRSATWKFAVIALIGVLVIIFVTFFALRYLIRKRITEPIDILSAEAGEVMEGNLDIDVVVHEGGEFVGLETAFKEMVESFRTYIAKSMGDE